MASTGQTSCSASVMNATRPPRVSECVLTAIAPRTMIRPMTAFGIRSSSAQNEPSRPAFSTWVRQTSAAWASCLAEACRPRPSAFSTRMPVAASSISVARSPCWSWTRRESTR